MSAYISPPQNHEYAYAFYNYYVIMTTQKFEKYLYSKISNIFLLCEARSAEDYTQQPLRGCCVLLHVAKRPSKRSALYIVKA